MPGYDSCEKQHKVGIKLMCPLVEKLLKLKKRMRQRAEKCSKELSRDALRYFHIGWFPLNAYIFLYVCV